MSENTHYAEFVIRVRAEFADNGEDDLRDQADAMLYDGPWRTVSSLLGDADYEIEGGIQKLPARKGE